MEEDNIQTINCVKCGKSISDTSKFCKYCGTEQKIMCRFCNNLVDNDSKFCPNCGKEIKGTATQNIPSDFVYVDGGSVGIKSFWCCKHPVTQEEYQNVMGNNPSHFKGSRNPVEKVDLYDAIEYCNKRSIKEGLKPYYNINGENIKINENVNGYRLLTISEWEFAARGGVKTRGYKYSGSNNIDEVAWYCTWDEECDNCDESIICDFECPFGSTHSVCLKKPNELGIYDMTGNVEEWCYIDQENYGYVTCGAWYSDESYCTRTGCSMVSYYCKFSALGFRVARNA